MTSNKIRKVEEQTITRQIIRKTADDWIDLAEVDVVIVGAGPSGLTAAKYLAESGLKVVVFERKLSFGGGIGGGGMLFHKILIQAPAEKILKEIGCKFESVKKGVYIVDTTELIARLAVGAIDAGAKVVLGVVVDDLIYRNPPPRVTGAVIQWTAVTMSGLHVDPLAVKAKAVVDCTGHDAEILATASRKIPELNISVPGEKSMWASKAEELTVKNTSEICPGLYAAGMAVAAVYQSPRMGPIFGGMLLSGKKVAGLIVKKLPFVR